MKTLLAIFALQSLVFGALPRARIGGWAGFQLWLPKLVAGGLSPVVAAGGLTSAVLGLLTRSRFSFFAGLAGAILATRHVRRASRPHDGFAQAYGPDWESRIPAAARRRLLPRRWSWWLPRGAEPRLEQNIAFWTVPDSGRKLLCDIWQPPAEVQPSGVAFIYLHGSGWHTLDKDWGTRLSFRHLAAQGHVVMDVAYRLCPEVDLDGMIGDAKRAIAWMKDSAPRYGVNPRQIVIGGGSAGGQLALLAAYAPDHPKLTPADLFGTELTVRAVISLYGPVDMRAYYENWRWWQLPEAAVDQPVAAQVNPAPIRSFAQIGAALGKLGIDAQMRNLLGGLPNEVPHRYDLASPLTHVGPHCPPTLLIHGEYDSYVPIEPTRELHRALAKAGVPSVFVEVPMTEHAFDLFLPACSPSAQAAMQDIQRFLALLAAEGAYVSADNRLSPDRAEATH